MHVTDDGMALKAGDALDALTDDGGAQMSHMEGLCHVGSAVVQHDGLGVRVRLAALAGVAFQLVHQFSQVFGGYIQIDEAGTDHLRLGEHGVACQYVHHLLGDHKGSLTVELCGSHSTVALVLAEVGTVGGGAAAQLRLKAGDLKGLHDPLRDLVHEFFHKIQPFKGKIKDNLQSKDIV